MATDADPLRTLGLAPGASADDIRRAYRRLAKANHPDSAGEAALPRFLAIQAAYEALLGPMRPRRPTARGPSASAPPQREPWRADGDRARRSRGRPGATGPSGARPGASDSPGAPGAGAAAGGADTRRRDPRRARDEPRRTGGRKRPSNKATLGSTTYDAAEDEPFEPEWSGGTWYGASSGTYWTVNPKEYADPRKHGPEYQRRARRPTEDPPPPAVGPSDAEEGHGPARDSETATGPNDADETFGSTPNNPPIHAETSRGSSDRHFAAAAAAAGAADARRLGLFGTLDPRGTGFGARVGLALIGWPPLGVAFSTVAGDVTGCGRFAAGCIDLFGIGTWLGQLLIIVVLLALPSVAALSAVGTLASLAAAIPAAVILSAAGGSRDPAASAAVLAAVLAVAYVGGVAFAIGRRHRHGRVP